MQKITGVLLAFFAIMGLSVAWSASKHAPPERPTASYKTCGPVPISTATPPDVQPGDVLEVVAKRDMLPAGSKGTVLGIDEDGLVMVDWHTPICDKNMRVCWPADTILINGRPAVAASETSELPW